MLNKIAFLIWFPRFTFCRTLIVCVCVDDDGDNDDGDDGDDDDDYDGDDDDDDVNVVLDGPQLEGVKASVTFSPTCQGCAPKALSTSAALEESRLPVRESFFSVNSSAQPTVVESEGEKAWEDIQ